MLARNRPKISPQNKGMSGGNGIAIGKPILVRVVGVLPAEQNVRISYFPENTGAERTIE
jgi:hypothetical protein